MKTYVIIALNPAGSKKMIWIDAENYDIAKEKFFEKYPDYEALTMWLRVWS